MNNRVLTAATLLNARFVPAPFVPVRAGYGSCSACSCPGYSGSSDGCSNWGCGHHYTLHW